MAMWSADVIGSSKEISVTWSTYTNIWDGTSTTVTATTPGWRVQPQYRGRIDSNNVPVVFTALLAQTSGTGGALRLRDSSGTICTISGFTDYVWAQATGNLDASSNLQKIDVQGSTTSGTMIVLALGLYQYET
jgi:hypothetical protein